MFTSGIFFAVKAVNIRGEDIKLFFAAVLRFGIVGIFRGIIFAFLAEHSLELVDEFGSAVDDTLDRTRLSAEFQYL